MKQLINFDTKGDPALEMLSKFQKGLAELNALKIQYHAIISEAELERQRYQTEVENLLNQLRGSVQRKTNFEKEREALRLSEKA